jgi:hypothetical protein
MDSGMDSDLERLVFVELFMCFSLLLILHEAVLGAPSSNQPAGNKKAAELGRLVLSVHRVTSYTVRFTQYFLCTGARARCGIIMPFEFAFQVLSESVNKAFRFAVESTS